MSFLIAEMALLLLVAALAGGLLGRWWVQRQFRDVSAEYPQLKERIETLEVERTQWKLRLSEIDAHVAQNGDRMETLVTQVHQSLAQQLQNLPPAKADLSPVLQELSTMQDTMAGQTQRLATLETSVADTQTQSWHTVEALKDLEPSIARNVGEQLAQQPQTDLSGLEGQLTHLQASVDAVQQSAEERFDLNDINDRFKAAQRMAKDRARSRWQQTGMESRWSAFARKAKESGRNVWSKARGAVGRPAPVEQEPEVDITTPLREVPSTDREREAG